MSLAERRIPRKRSGRTVTEPDPRMIFAPKSTSAAVTARSPWTDWGDMPVTVRGAVPRAPAQSQKAAFDQSPSTAREPGVR